MIGNARLSNASRLITTNPAISKTAGTQNSHTQLSDLVSGASHARIRRFSSLLEPYCYRQEKPASMSKSELEALLHSFPDLPKKARISLENASYHSTRSEAKGDKVLPVPYFRAGEKNELGVFNTYVARDPYVAMHYLLDAQAQGEPRRLYCIIPKHHFDQRRLTLLGQLLGKPQGDVGRCTTHHTRFLTPEHFKNYEAIELKLGPKQREFIDIKIRALRQAASRHAEGQRVSFNDTDAIRDEAVLGLLKMAAALIGYCTVYFVCGDQTRNTQCNEESGIQSKS